MVSKNESDLDSNFISACHKGKLAEVKVYLEQGANINAADNANKSGLYYAIKNNHISVARLLIQNNIDVDVNWFLKVALTKKKNPTLAVILIDTIEEVPSGWFLAGYDQNWPDFISACLKTRSISNSEKIIRLKFAIKFKQPKIAKLIIESCSEIPSEINFMLCENGWSQHISLCLQKGMNISAKNSDGQTPLHVAVTNGHIDLVKLIIEKDIKSLFVKNESNETPFEQAIKLMPTFLIHVSKNFEIATLMHDKLVNYVDQNKELLLPGQTEMYKNAIQAFNETRDSIVESWEEDSKYLNNFQAEFN